MGLPWVEEEQGRVTGAAQRSWFVSMEESSRFPRTRIWLRCAALRSGRRGDTPPVGRQDSLLKATGGTQRTPGLTGTDTDTDTEAAASPGGGHRLSARHITAICPPARAAATPPGNLDGESGNHHNAKHAHGSPADQTAPAPVGWWRILQENGLNHCK